MDEEIDIKSLYDELVASGAQVIKHKDYDLVNCVGIQVLTYGNKYVDVNCVSRHKTTKHLMKLTIESAVDVGELFPSQKTKFQTDLTTTSDHVCMVYDRDKIFHNIKAADIDVGDYVSVYDPTNDQEYLGSIAKIDDLGTTTDYVYDLEVDDGMHTFYAQNVLSHNSQFMNLQCVSDWMKKEYNLPDKIRDWKQEDRQHLWDRMTKFTEDEINPFVRSLVHKFCNTNNQDVLTYELEYMGDVGVYESKKHYCLHKIFEEGDAVDKIKVTGIELKKGNVPKEMKKFLEDIYMGVVTQDWKEKDYIDYVNSLYDEFTKFKVDEIAFWKGYNTEREATGFLQMQIGTTGISKSCIYYNQIINKLGLGKKYNQIIVGNKVRQLYILPSNRFGIDTIAYLPGGWPKEFDDIFQIDYKKMFNKLILDPLKRFRIACKFKDHDPSKQVQFDLFDL